LSRHKVHSWLMSLLLLGCVHTSNLQEGKSAAQSLDFGIDPAQAIRLLRVGGGFTIHWQRGNLAGSELYAVSAYPERHVKLERFPTMADIKAFVDTNKELLREESNS